MARKILNDKVRTIFSLLKEGGAKEVLIVGGFVRDHLLGLESKDVDLEVYGLSYRKIEEILRCRFRVGMVGQSFGVLKVGRPSSRHADKTGDKAEDEREIDVALPRRESKQGIGHKGFDIESDPSLTFEEAFARRDFTINAIGMREDGTFVDPYGGRADLKRKILRATSPAFKEDPLRVLRGVQFAARFGFAMDETTVAYCKEVFSEFSTLPEERIYEEWKKWAIRGEFPSLGLDVLKETGWIDAFPELAALVDCPQNPDWHPEGDVWTHTKLVCNEARRAIQNADRDGKPFSEEEQIALMFAAVGHDFGKPLVTRRDENGIIRSLGHAEAGEPLARAFLARMKAPNRISEMVEPLVREHMVITHHRLGLPTPKTVRRLACRLHPANLRLWVALCQSDALGCFPPATQKRTVRFRAEDWLLQAEQAEVTDDKPKPLVLGRHLIPLGILPGPEMGAILHFAFEAQLDGEFATTEEGIAWLTDKGRIKDYNGDSDPLRR